MENGKNYDVLCLISKWAILAVYVKAVIFGLWVLIKWLIYGTWNSFNQKSNKKITKTEQFDGYHDQPPSILVDNRLGRHSYIKLKNVKLHFVETGKTDNPLIILLHGFPDCWLGWRNQIQELAVFFHIISLDMKGFNDSDKPIWRRAYTPKIICEEIRLLIVSLGYKTATIIGHDIGAIVGWFFAHTNPDSIERFICISTSHPNLVWNNIHPKAIINTSWLQFVQLPFIPEIEHLAKMSTFLEQCLKVVPCNSTKAVNSFYKIRYSTNDSEYNFNLIDTYKYVFSRRNDWTGPFNYYRNFPFFRIEEDSMVRCPVLIITGSEDNFCRLESIVKSTEYCQNFVVKIIEGAGHWPHQQVPTEFNKIILNFLVGQRAKSQEAVFEKSPKSIVGRMLGAVTQSMKMGSSVLDTVQQRTNNVLHSSLY